jgi:hypothetical protein
VTPLIPQQKKKDGVGLVGWLNLAAETKRVRHINGGHFGGFA